MQEWAFIRDNNDRCMFISRVKVKVPSPNQPRVIIASTVGTGRSRALSARPVRCSPLAPSYLPLLGCHSGLSPILLHRISFLTMLLFAVATVANSNDYDSVTIGATGSSSYDGVRGS